MTMRNLCLTALLLLLLSGCDKETPPPSNKVKIEWEYPYYVSKESLDEIDKDKIELFDYHIFLINAANQLDENPLLVYFTEDVQNQIKLCDFEHYSLIVCSSLSLYEIAKLEHSIYKNDTGYDYCLTVRYPNHFEEPIESIYFLVAAFCVKKIADDSILNYYTSAVPLK